MDLTELLKLLGGAGGGDATASGSNPLQNVLYAIARLQGQDHGAATAFAQNALQGQQGGTQQAATALNMAPAGVTNGIQSALQAPTAFGTAGAPQNSGPATQLPQAGNSFAQPQAPQLPSGPTLPSPKGF